MAVNAKQQILEIFELNDSKRRAILEAMRPAFSRVCIQSFAKGDFSMYRSQQWLQLSIATLMFTVTSFAQKEHVPNRLV